MALPSTGYEIARYSDIKETISEGLLNDVSPSLNLEGDSVLGQNVSIYSAALAELYEFGAAIYDSKNINAAEGTFLEDLGALVLTPRGTATASTGNLLLTTSAATTIPAGSSYSDPSTGLSYTTDLEAASTDDGLLVSRRKLSLASVVSTATYSVDINTQTHNSTATATSTPATVLQELVDRINLQDPIATAVLTDANNITITLRNPTTTANITSSDLTGEEDSVPVNITCTTTANDEVPAGSITVMDADPPLAGLVSVTNVLALSRGDLAETDSQYRTSIRQGTTSLSSGTLDRLYLNVSDLVGVSYVLVEENTTEATVGSIPAKAFRVLVEGGSDVSIANAIWKTKPAGKQPYGDSSYTILDNQGAPHTVAFQRINHVVTVMSITVSLDTDKGTTGAIPVDYIKTKIVEWANSYYSVGKDVVETEFYEMLYRELGEYRFKDVLVTGAVSGIKSILSTEKAFFTLQWLTINTSSF